uniref:DUF6234 family protein n=1 Tax=Streptomyces sp. NBC_00049 TaxID=2903617 RepID=A0AAU2JTI3_9ACTN
MTTRSPAEREPVHWAADFILAVIALALLAAVLAGGWFLYGLGRWGETEPDPDPVWRGIPLGSGTFVFIGVLCCLAATASFGFFRLRAGIAGTLLGMACILLIGLAVVLGSERRQADPPPAPTWKAPNCHSGGGHTDCPGG